MKLLISVRDPDEAVAAIRGGADIIDVKEPTRGSLGAASVGVVRSIALHCTQMQRPLSVACGELSQPGFQRGDLAHLADAQYVKIGLSGCALQPHWAEQLQAFWSQWKPEVTRVAVAYADWQTCGAPDPQQVIMAGQGIAQVFLLDTYAKGSGLLEQVSRQTVGKWVQTARERQMEVAIAGSLTPKDFPVAAAHLRADIVAVRGAACEGSRTSVIQESRVANLCAELKRAAAA